MQSIKQGEYFLANLKKRGNTRSQGRFRGRATWQTSAKVRLICSKFKLCSKKLAQNHTTPECGRVPYSFQEELLQSMEVPADTYDQRCRDKSTTCRCWAELSNNFDDAKSVSRYFLVQENSTVARIYQMQKHMWHQIMQQQHMHPESQQMYGQYTPVGDPQTWKLANMPWSVSAQGSMQGMMHAMESKHNQVGLWILWNNVCKYGFDIVFHGKWVQTPSQGHTNKSYAWYLCHWRSSQCISSQEQWRPKYQIS